MANIPTGQCPYGQKDCPGGSACVCALPTELRDGPPFTLERYGNFSVCILAERDWLRIECLQAIHERDCAIEDLARLSGYLHSLGWEPTADGLRKLPDEVTTVNQSELLVENKRLAEDIGYAYSDGFEGGYSAGFGDMSVRLREAIEIVKLHATAEHWAWIREVEGELSDDVTETTTGETK